MAADGIVRDAVVGDREAIAEIYNEGIAEGRSTFETQPLIVASLRAHGGEVLGEDRDQNQKRSVEAPCGARARGAQREPEAGGRRFSR